MWSAVTADSQPTDVTEYLAQLQLENVTLRELLTAGRHSLVSPVCSQAVQTDAMSLPGDDEVNTSASSVNTSVSSSGESDVVNSTVVTASQHSHIETEAADASPLATPAAADVVVSNVSTHDT